MAIYYRSSVSTLTVPRALVGFATCLLVSFVAADLFAGVTVFESAGATPASITPTRDAFRAAVGGGSVAAANGDFGGLRREINWDAVPEQFSDPNPLPGNFFNSNSPRGAVFTTPGLAFRVSANTGNSTGTPILFNFPDDLQTFTPQKLFGAVGSGITDVTFFVPGTNTPATTTAFAAVFVDTEDDNGVTFTKMDFFDDNNALLFSRNVLPGGEPRTFVLRRCGKRWRKDFPRTHYHSEQFYYPRRWS
ncbi:MAG: hypothetical protein O2931_04290 [Planctomycetota bacterium]|nr:hypothetical protein [Planctomycetota bacterium]MDA1178000.1 hypothetical protein [Planctomycetota bacterium]